MLVNCPVLWMTMRHEGGSESEVSASSFQCETTNSGQQPRGPEAVMLMGIGPGKDAIHLAQYTMEAPSNE